jgi:hypothetical protein|nr:MAG TPA: hypothetical protein [Caudoviricetes sp.]
MYINIDHYLKSGLLYSDLIFLVGIKQTNKEILETLTDDTISRFKELNLITSIKGKKGEDERLKIRLNEKGKELMIKLSFEGSEDEETTTIKNWIISVYKNKEGGIVKNKTELGRRLQWFKTVTNIQGNFLAVLIQCAMQDTYNNSCGQTFYEYKKDNPRAMLSNLAENLFWSPESIYDKHKTLDKSPLYTYFEDNKEYVEQVWKTNLDEDGNRRK